VFKNFASLFTGNPFSKSTAKNRLQMVLVQDRSGLSANEMDRFREEILGVISKYFVLENTSLDIEWQRSDISTALIINTPVVGRSSLGRAAPEKSAA